MVLRKDLRVFCGLLQRIIPLEVHSNEAEPTYITDRSSEEVVVAEMQERGISAGTPVPRQNCTEERKP